MRARPHIDIPDDTCPFINDALREIAPLQKWAGAHYTKKFEDLDPDDTVRFIDDCDTYFRAAPDQLEDLRDQNSALREGFYEAIRQRNEALGEIDDFEYKVKKLEEKIRELENSLEENKMM